MKIAILRLDHLGDAVMTTGFVKACREFWPDAELTMICTGKTKAFWKACPFLDRIISGKAYGAPYDLLINPRPAPDYMNAAAVAAVIDAPFKIAFRQTDFPMGINPNPGYTNLVYLKRPLELAWLAPFRLLQSLGYGGDAYAPMVWTKPEDEQFADEALSSHRWVAFGVGASSGHHRWPTERYEALAHELMEKYGFRALCVGAESDRPILTASCPNVDFLGKTTIPQLAAVLGRCKLFVGNDSAPKHIAAAVGTPVVEISWVSGQHWALDYDRAFTPTGANFRIVQPSRDFSLAELWREEGIRSIPVEQVFQQVVELLA